MKTVVLYHANCLDGFGAAYACWKHFGNNAEYIPVTYNEPVPDAAIAADNIYCVDFSYKANILAALAELRSVTVIDHHETAEAELAELMVTNVIDGIFDMEKSGAVLAWEWFTKAKVPGILLTVQDRDLWQFKLPDTRAITMALYGRKSTLWQFRAWDNLVMYWDRESNNLRKQGELLIEIQDEEVSALMKKATIVEWFGYDTFLVNCHPKYSSDLGELLASARPNAVMVTYSDSSEKRTFSLRSKNVNVADITKKFGGGGHKAAAGFSHAINQKEFL